MHQNKITNLPKYQKNIINSKENIPHRERNTVNITSHTNYTLVTDETQHISRIKYEWA